MRPLLFIIFLIVGTTSTVFAQSTKVSGSDFKKNSIRVNPLSFVFQSINFQLERYINPFSSIQLGYTQVLDPMFFGESSWEGKIITAEYRYYFSVKRAAKELGQISARDKKIMVPSVISHKKRKKIKRTFIAPYLRYQDLFSDAGSTNGGPYLTEQFNTFGGGLIVGRVIELSNWLVLDYFIGINYQSGKDQLINAGGTTDWLNPQAPLRYKAPKAWFGWGPRAGISIGVQF